MVKKRAVVLLSGGIDSSTTLAIAVKEGYDCFALSFDYAQRHNLELESAAKVARSLGARRHLTVRFDMREIGGSALTSDIAVPKKDASNQAAGRSETDNDPASSGYTEPTIPVTYVPARNTIFLSFGLGWAEVLKAEDIFIGANVVDYSGYPDCRPEFLRAFEKMANLATKISVEGTMRFRIHAPLIQMTKQAIINRGSELGLDYGLTWSCYDPQPCASGVMMPCGRCDSCNIRSQGFREAGIRDPLIE